MSERVVRCFSEAATETVFKISFLFRQEQPFYNFPGCSSYIHFFSSRVYMFFEQTRIFQEGLSNRHVFQGRSICSSNIPYYLIEHFPNNTYEFFRNLYFLIEQVFIFQEALSRLRSHTIFQDTSMPQTDRCFPGRCP